MSDRIIYQLHERFTTNLSKESGVKSRIYILVVLILQVGCVSKGYVTDSVSPELYQFPRELSPEVHKRNPTFLVYGDQRPSWRALERFAEKRNWLNKRMLIFPIYVPWLFLNGAYGGVNYLRFVPDFGKKERLAVLNQIYAEVERENIDFIASLGDIVTNGAYARQWEQFLKETGVDIALLQKVPYWPAVGNHDHPNEEGFGKRNYDTVFPYSRFYTKRFKDILLIFIDSTIILDQKNHIISEEEQETLFRKYIVSGGESESRSWLEDELVNSEEKYKILFMHHPPFSFGKHSNDWNNTEWGNDMSDKRKQLLNLLKEHDVQAVFAGHEHYYEHNVLRYRMNDEEREMHIVITGGGGTPIRPLEPIEKVQKQIKHEQAMGNDVRMITRAEEYNYCIVKVSEEGINVEVKSVEDGNLETATILDFFDIH